MDCEPCETWCKRGSVPAQIVCMHMRTPKPVERDLTLLAPMVNCRQYLRDCCAVVAFFSLLVARERFEQAAPERLVPSMIRLRRRWQSCRCRRRCSGWSGSLRRSTPCARSCSRSTSRRVAPGRPPAFLGFCISRLAFLLGHSCCSQGCQGVKLSRWQTVRVHSTST